MGNGTRLLGWRKRWNRNLLRFIGKRIRGGMDVEDLAQETYLRLLRARDLGDVRNPQAYLLTVASHVVSEWRHQQPAQELFEEVNEETLVEEVPLDLAIDAETFRTALEHALQELPPLTRAVVVLRFRENRSCKDVAGDLQLTDRQVRRHLTRAFERLRQTLKVRG